MFHENVIDKWRLHIGFLCRCMDPTIMSPSSTVTGASNMKRVCFQWVILGKMKALFKVLHLRIQILLHTDCPVNCNFKSRTCIQIWNCEVNMKYAIIYLYLVILYASYSENGPVFNSSDGPSSSKLWKCALNQTVKPWNMPDFSTLKLNPPLSLWAEVRKRNIVNICFLLNNGYFT